MKNKIENLVCDLKLSKKIKELGVEQESLFYWWRYCEDVEFELIYTKPEEIVEYFSAFTVAELGMLLPNKNEIGWFSEQVACLTSWVCRLWELNIDHVATFHDMFFADTEASARAKMFIYLLENNLINVKNNN